MNTTELNYEEYFLCKYDKKRNRYICSIIGYKKKFFMNEYYLLEHDVQLIHYYLNVEIDLFLSIDVFEKLHDDFDYY